MHDSTKANLEAAFAGESQAGTKYAIFAEVAEKEGHPQVARLFRATSFAEKVHAANHLRELAGIRDTAANLETAAAGERYEHTEMYPAFTAEAKKHGDKGAIRSMHYALKAEEIHEEFYSQARESILAGKDIESAPVFVCPVCGHTAIGEAPDKCPVCGAAKNEYHQF